MAQDRFPYKVATLLYCFDRSGRVLLLQRAQEPNKGFWSPSGGKLKTEFGESPWMCACREAKEEMGVDLSPANLHLTGIVSESGYQGSSHWLMFLFEVMMPFNELPPPHREGVFAWFHRCELSALPIPETDREKLWPLFWGHRGGFFAAHCECLSDGRNLWQLEQSNPQIV